MHFGLRAIVVLCAVGAPMCVPAARADDKATPTITLRLKSIDGLLGDAEFLAAAAGRENEAAQFGGLVRQQKGPKGIFGIDTTRPLGAYAKLSQDLFTSAGVVMVPVADQEAFLKQLEMFNINPNKDKDGVYSLAVPGVPVQVYFKFANKYLYLSSPSKLALDSVLPPDEVLRADDKSALTVTANLDQVPENLRQMFFERLDQERDNQLKKDMKVQRPGETEASRRIRAQTAEATGKQLLAWLKEGKRVKLSLNIDQHGKNVAADVSFAAVGGSSTARGIAELGRSTSVFGTQGKPDDAVSILTHVVVPDSIRKQFTAAIEEAKKDAGKEPDAVKRGLVQRALDALEPSLRTGELDGVIRVVGPTKDHHFSVLAGAKLKDGAALADAFRAAVAVIPAPDKALIELDAENVGGGSIHRLNAQSKYDPIAKSLFGENPVHVAILPGAFLVAAGPSGLELMKSAAGLQPQAAPQFSLAFSMRHLAPLLALGDKKNAAFVPAAQKAFGSEADNDTVRLTVQGGDELKLSFAVKTPVIRLLAEVAEKQGK